MLPALPLHYCKSSLNILSTRSFSLWYWVFNPGLTHIIQVLYHLSTPQFFCLYFVFEIGSYFVAWAGLNLSVFLPLPPQELALQV
jgi:hypothetical protein